MSWSRRFKLDDITKEILFSLVDGEQQVFLLNSNENQPSRLSASNFKFSQLVGIGVQDSVTGHTIEDIPRLKKWLDVANDLVVGYFSYDAKNLVENLNSRNKDSIGFPAFHFVIPEIVALVNDDGIECFSHGRNLKTYIPTSLKDSRAMVAQDAYVSVVEKLCEHIQRGDIYEVNYCVEHKIENVSVAPFRLYQELQEISPAPFSCYVADNGKYLMSSSPERFMLKRGNKIVSQPMKGTNRRTAYNELQKEALRNDSKEVTENVMITDLVRNDLARSAKKGSVKVDELCGVYEFEHVNQMISTVSAELREDVHPLDAILNAFPMGSMTGAPKISAMELIDQYEDFSRGLYSGAVGYFTPDLDFDFNVIIRSILYNEFNKVVTFPTGSAITINSDPEKEYEECMLKAEAMRKVLLNHAK
jgi:para-aminobenzoate synthetase component 1